ncbi:MAG TPA: DUF2071 domain-containing protein [Gemmatimonadaceae bacterium]|nr:DUF2071 domain-containing protein [Gemmatimonadaceae bacterium]
MQPDAKPFLSAEWRDLAMLNYLVPSDLLLPLVPAGTELDTWRGATYISVVGFRFVSTRVLGLSIPGHVDFEEVNLRFYVRRQAKDGWRRGVVFIRELVPRRAIAWIARLWYNEPYRALPMRHAIDRSSDHTPNRVRYEWRRSGEWEGLALRTKGASRPLTPGSEAEFITEHYWGYTRQRDGSTIEYRVEHPPWKVWEAEDARLSCDVASLYGSQFVRLLEGTPQSAFLADGSHVVVFRPEPLR